MRSERITNIHQRLQLFSSLCSYSFENGVANWLSGCRVLASDELTVDNNFGLSKVLLVAAGLFIILHYDHSLPKGHLP